MILKQCIPWLVVASIALAAGPSFAESTDSSETTQRRYIKKKKKKKKKKRKKPVNLVEASLVNKVLNVGAGGLGIGFTNASLECDCTGKAPEYDSETGLFAVGRYEKAMGPLLSYAGEIGYAEKGARLDAPGDDLIVTCPTCRLQGS